MRSFNKLIPFLLILFSVSCLKDPEVEPNEPDAPTLGYDDLTTVSFLLSGKVNEKVPDTFYGLKVDGVGEKEFQQQELDEAGRFFWRVEGLSAGTSYVVRSFVANGFGKKYSKDMLISTPMTSLATLSEVTKDNNYLRATIMSTGGRKLMGCGFIAGYVPDRDDLELQRRIPATGEIFLLISELARRVEIDRTCYIIAYVNDMEGGTAYSPNVLELGLNEIYTLSVNPEEGITAIQIGETLKMKADLNPAVNLAFEWSSDNVEVATVDKDGVVTGVSAGTCTIKAIHEELEATCVVTVNPVPVSSISLDRDQLEMTEGGTYTLHATVLPENATDKSVVWISSDETVASVLDGLVTAIKEGSATITARAGDRTATCQVTVNAAVIPVSSITLDRSSLTLEEGQSETLVATVLPIDATDKSVVWMSSDESVATVLDGLVTAIKEGSATITARAGDKTATCEVTVNAVVIPVSSITLSQTSMDITVGQTSILIPTVKPDNATDKNVSWSSSNPAIASVDQGLVTGISAGTAMISAKAGDKTATCFVSVSTSTIPVESISLNHTTLSIPVGQTETLMATVLPATATDKTVYWSSSNTVVATISQSGLVTAIAAGTATITAKAGDKTATCVVTVTDPNTIPVSLVSFGESEREVYVGENFTLTATVSPSTATNKQLNWTSSDTSIATVDQEGHISPVGVGNCTIKATATSGVSASFICKVVSIAPVIPDEGFRNYIISNFDINNDGQLSRTEVKQVQGITYTGESCTSLAGIEWFDEITTLCCNDNLLTSLDLNSNIKLKQLDCSNNQIISLNISHCSELWDLHCSHNQLSTIDLKGCPVLKYLYAQSNLLSNLDMSSNTYLLTLFCDNNLLTSLDFNSNPKLQKLYCNNNQLSSLVLTYSVDLQDLDCDHNLLSVLELNNNQSLRILNCYENQLQILVLGNNTELEHLDCSYNQITSLTVDNNLALRYLNCYGNQLTVLDVRQNSALSFLSCLYNPITDIWLIAGHTFDYFNYPSTATLHYE